MSRQLYSSLYERMLANSQIPEGQSEATGCWEWTAKLDGKRGGEYGRMNVRVDGKHKTLAPHRVMESLFQERDLHPDDETIEHLCNNTRCVNPDHLVTMTRSENTAQMRKRNGR